MGMGISGGEEGARHGPSLMPGGPLEAFAAVEAILSRCAAQVDDGPCVAYMGPIGSGNYVKMIHNGEEKSHSFSLIFVLCLLQCGYVVLCYVMLCCECCRY